MEGKEEELIGDGFNSLKANAFRSQTFQRNSVRPFDLHAREGSAGIKDNQASPSFTFMK